MLDSSDCQEFLEKMARIGPPLLRFFPPCPETPPSPSSPRQKKLTQQREFQFIIHHCIHAPYVGSKCSDHYERLSSVSGRDCLRPRKAL
jgi:hypothetical protein